MTWPAAIQIDLPEIIVDSGIFLIAPPVPDRLDLQFLFLHSAECFLEIGFTIVILGAKDFVQQARPILPYYFFDLPVRE